MDPARVLGFLDVASGKWDPSLAFVLVAGVGVAVQRNLRRPALDAQFHLPPTHSPIDSRLIGGSALFGLGWGLAGVLSWSCHHRAFDGLPAAFIFVAAMAAGMMLHDRAVLKRV